MQNANCDPEGEKATYDTLSCRPKLNALLGQGGVMSFPARRSSLLAEQTLFHVVRSATNGRTNSGIKCRGVIMVEVEVFALVVCRATRGVRTWDSGDAALRSITASELGMVRNVDASLEDESVGQNKQGRLPMVLGNIRYAGEGDNR
jgi:hypothetical protein